MKKNTLTSNVIRILIITMIFLLLLFLCASYMFYLKSKQDFEQKKEYSINVSMKFVKERLDKAELQLNDLMLNILDVNDLNSSDEMLKYFAKSRVSTMIKNKLAVNGDVDCFFVKNLDCYIVKGYNIYTPSSSRKNIMKYLWKGDSIDTSTVANSQWRILEIEGKAYFYLAYKMKGCTVGALIRVSSINNNLNLILNQDFINYSYIENNKYVYTYGEEIPRGDGYNKFIPLNGIIIVENSIPDTDIKFVGYCKFKILNLLLSNTFYVIFGMIVIFMVMLFILKRKISQYIIDPIYILLEGTNHLAKGKFDYRIEGDAGSTEFNALNNSFNKMVHEIKILRIDQYEQKIKDSERKIRMLRMQIKPHFYLNAITTIQSMTYQDRVEDIRTYLDALSDHIRYMLRFNCSEVKLSEELSHIENYLKMQNIKFPNSVAYYMECKDELKNKEIGHLLLSTIIQNSLKYAMNLYDILLLLIQCEVVENNNFKGYKVIIEDNGKGFSSEQLERFQIGKDVEESKDEKHIGLSNIRKSLELQYGRKDLLRMSNVEPHGARVEIWIPNEKNMLPEEEIYENFNC